MSDITGGNDNPVIQGAATPMFLGTMEPGFKEERVGPILTVERFRNEYLWGIPKKAILTGEELTDDILKQFILKGIGDLEMAVRIAVNPVKIEDRFDFERADDLMFSTRRMTRWPILSVEKLRALWPGRNETLPGQSQEIDYPTSWVTLQGDMGLVRIIPNSGTVVNADVSFLASSAYRTAVLGGLKTWPNMWRITYIAGLNFDQIPSTVNDCIGVMAALKLLSMLGPVLFPFNSQSVGIDGMSQSMATPGPMWLQQRMAELAQERDRLVQLLKNYYGTDLYFSVW